jgi:hypothetical protein
MRERLGTSPTDGCDDPHRLTQAAFDAIVATLPLDSLGPEINAKGERLI